MKRILYSLVASSLILVASYAAAAPQKEKSAAPKPPSMENADRSESPSLSGKVVETMNSGGYSYVCIEKNGKKTWVAVPEMKVSVGKEMSFQPGQAMPNFTSKSLNKTFDVIIFSGGPASSEQGAGGMPAGHGAAAAGSGSKSAASVDLKNIKVEKASGPNAYTVAEIFAKRSSLHKKAVAVKGKVVKVSAGIMGKNWVHVQDGSGDPKKSTHNLVVTSNDLPAVGDVVTVKGTMFKDKDFGAGYKYVVIVEQATFEQ